MTDFLLIWGCLSVVAFITLGMLHQANNGITLAQIILGIIALPVFLFLTPIAVLALLMMKADEVIVITKNK